MGYGQGTYRDFNRDDSLIGLDLFLILENCPLKPVIPTKVKVAGKKHDFIELSFDLRAYFAPGLRGPMI